jgi:hypothetical protein
MHTNGNGYGMVEFPAGFARAVAGVGPSPPSDMCGSTTARPTVPFPQGPPVAPDAEPRVILSMARFGADTHHRAGRLVGRLDDRVLIMVPGSGVHEFSRSGGEWMAGPDLNFVDYVVHERDFVEKVSTLLDQAANKAGR